MSMEWSFHHSSEGASTYPPRPIVREYSACKRVAVSESEFTSSLKKQFKLVSQSEFTSSLKKQFKLVSQSELTSSLKKQFKLVWQSEFTSSLNKQFKLVSQSEFTSNLNKQLKLVSQSEFTSSQINSWSWCHSLNLPAVEYAANRMVWAQSVNYMFVSFNNNC